MNINIAKKQFLKFLETKQLKETSQREQIVDMFLRTKEHVSTDDFYDMVKKKYPAVGYSTVYRTLKLLAEAGLAKEVDFADGRKRFDPNYLRQDHEHMVCTHCGKAIEFYDPLLEKLEKEVTRKYNFTPNWHRLEIFGLCKNCQ